MNHRSSGRKGSVLVVVLVCLGFAATVLMGALRTSLQQRRQLRNEHDSLQVEWLLDAGVRLSMKELSNDDNYLGQKTTVKEGLRAGQVGVVSIKVSRDPSSGRLATVLVNAKLERPSSSFEIQRSRSFSFPLNESGSN